jgi:hypothetical protein
LKHKNTQASSIFNRENPQNSEPQNGPRRGLDFIALIEVTIEFLFVEFPSTYSSIHFADMGHTLLIFHVAQNP